VQKMQDKRILGTVGRTLLIAKRYPFSTRTCRMRWIPAGPFKPK